MEKIIGQLHQSFAEAEEKVFKDVLRSLLKREPTIEDAKECNFLHREGELDKYGVDYKGMFLGTIQRVFPDMNSTKHEYMVVFMPASDNDFLEPYELNGKQNVNINPSPTPPQQPHP